MRALLSSRPFSASPTRTSSWDTPRPCGWIRRSIRYEKEGSPAALGQEGRGSFAVLGTAVRNHGRSGLQRLARPSIASRSPLPPRNNSAHAYAAATAPSDGAEAVTAWKVSHPHSPGVSRRRREKGVSPRSAIARGVFPKRRRARASSGGTECQEMRGAANDAPMPASMIQENPDATAILRASKESSPRIATSGCPRLRRQFH